MVLAYFIVWPESNAATLSACGLLALSRIMSEDLLSVSTQLQMSAQHRGPAPMFEELHTDLHLNTIASPPQTPFAEEWLIHTFFLSASHHHHHHHNPPPSCEPPTPTSLLFPYSEKSTRDDYPDSWGDREDV